MTTPGYSGAGFGTSLPWGSIGPEAVIPAPIPLEDGYGLGGAGYIEPWGSVSGAPGIPRPLEPRNLAKDLLGIIEVTTGAIGEADTEIGGFRVTRLIQVVNEGDTEFPVESILGWPEEGKVSIDGIVYTYEYSVDNVLYDVSYQRHGITTYGAAKQHRVESPVLDLNRSWSALDRLRRAILVEYAEGEDLDTIGRNLGVPRKQIYGNDNQYREVIKAVAYSPKATIYGLELALDSILGNGNYEIYEDLIKYPYEIFFRITNEGILLGSYIGKTFLNDVAFSVLSGSDDTLSVPYEPLQIVYAKIKNLGETFDFRNEIPSNVLYPYYEGVTPAGAFDYIGGLPESNQVSVVNGQTYFDTNISGDPAYYEMPLEKGGRVTENSKIEIEWSLKLATGLVLASGKQNQISIGVKDGIRQVNVGIDSDFSIGLYTLEGSFIGNTKTLSLDQYYDVRLVKNGSQYVELWIDGMLISRELISSFTTSTSDNKIEFGSRGTTVDNVQFYTKQIAISVINTEDWWSNYVVSKADFNSSTPNVIILGTGPTYEFGDDVGKQIEILGSGITNSYGGNNNGTFIIEQINTPTEAVLTGEQKIGASSFSGNPGKIIIDDGAKFKYPDDLGKKLELSGDSPGNNGIWIITALLREGTDIDIASFNSVNEEWTNACILLGMPNLVTEEDMEYRILPNFENESDRSFRISDAGNVSGATLTLKKGSPYQLKNGMLMEIGLTRVPSAQLLRDTSIINMLIDTGTLKYEYYPFYLVDFAGSLLEFIDELTAAGVIPSYKV